MSLENGDRSSPYRVTEPSSQTQKRSKISYTRDFLLSLSELEICKKLPSGFDESILSEFEDTSYGNQDRQRIQGSLPSQGFRRIEYSSSPPTRGDSGSSSRGANRWDSRSSARSDRDSDSQSDRDSDSIRRYGNQSRRSWQGPEHDGLLGSGSFPRPSGYGAGISATKVQTNDTYQLNRSNEPYHPPRPYKAVPLSRRDAHDSFNDETFGSTESMTEDRVEEEKRRRVSFELMRKEQQKALQEKQKMNLEKNKTGSVSDLSILLDGCKVEKKVLDRNDESDMAASGSASSVDSGKSVLHSQTPTFRPLVPPGFTNMAQEKNSGLKSLVHSHSAEVGRSEIEECLLNDSAQNGTLGGTQKSSSRETSVSDQQLDSKIMHTPMLNIGDQFAKSSLMLDSSNKKVGLEELIHQTSVLPEVHESSDEPEIIELDSKVAGLKLGDEFKENDTKSILEKIFGNSLTVNVSNSMDKTELHDNQPDETWSPNTVHSSKFARWFVEEERKTDGDHSSSRPSDLLSLIVGSDKSKSRVSDMNDSEPLQPQFPHQSSELADQSTTSMLSATNGDSEPLQNSSKHDIVQNILTCEDLEQTILSEYSETGSNLQPPLPGLNVTGAKSEKPRAPIDDQASQHLLSLLQKGTSHDNTTPTINADIDTSAKSPASDVYNVGASLYKTNVEDAQNIQNSGKTVTLETLFGTAFMQELQSVEAPVSVHRGSVESAHTDSLGPQGLAFPVKDGLFPSEIDHIVSEKTSNVKNILASNSRQQMMLDKTQKWLGNDDPHVEFNLSKNHPIVGSKRGVFDGAVDYQLPEEESLISVNDDLNPQLSKFLAMTNSRQNESLSSNASGDIAEKLAAIGAAIRVERSTLGSDGPPIVRGPYNQTERDIQYRDLHPKTSSPYFHSQQTGHGRPLLQPLDSHPSHLTSQLKFMGPERMFQQDASGNQQFPANMLQPPFHHPNIGVAGFELTGHRPMLRQMQMPGNYPPHLVNDFPRGASVPHLGTQAAGIMQEPNPIPGYPFGPRQPNIGGLGMPIPAPDINGGTDHPEAFQRLVDMERRANSKQMMPPFAGHGQGMYGHHELDLMRFR